MLLYTQPNMHKHILQVISVCPKDSRTIEKAGANRIQLVSALQIGGLTPSPAIIRKSLQCVDIPTMVMVRHHNNGFYHSQQQIQLFMNQIGELIHIGVKGIVVGGIDSQKKQIDLNLIKLVNQSVFTNKVDWTFHKAFDELNIVQNYQRLCINRVPRVLTQGGKEKITNNYDVLSKIIEQSKQEDKFKTKVLLGGGITSENVQQIIKLTKTSQIHVGTCVRKDKYGQVIGQKVQEIVSKMNKAYQK